LNIFVLATYEKFGGDKNPIASCLRFMHDFIMTHAKEILENLSAENTFVIEKLNYVSTG
jgi:hypothetical protein